VRIVETPLAGVVVVEPERHEDDRGWFARAWDGGIFSERGLLAVPVQASTAFNRRRGTLRGMHLQAPPHEEDKLVSCTRGAIFDVAVDLRRDSPTHRQWFGLELTGGDGRALHVPRGVAHGYLTLVDETETQYLISAPYAPDAARGVRWDDPAFAIDWPSQPVHVISDRDRSWPDYE
jgi:dTDP-4-dehydrorhamnose 3,5-epimerase